MHVPFSFERGISMLRTGIKRLTKQANALSEGYLLEKIDVHNYRSYEKQLAKSMTSLQQQLLNQIFEMQVVASQIDHSTTEIHDMLQNQKLLSETIYAGSKSLRHANERNIAHVKSTLELATNMRSNTQALQTQSTNLEQSSQASLLGIKEQINGIFAITTTISEIDKASQTATSSVSELLHSTKKIDEILKTVQDFYKQTQLLALNASIESARAGEAGKGFAVVATEIRNLAENSSHSVGEISSILNEIQNAIDHVIDGNKSTSLNIQEAVNYTKTVESGLTAITSSFEHVDERILEMKETLESNLALIETLTTSVDDTYQTSEMLDKAVSSIHDEIKAQHKQTEDIERLEINLKDTSKSLHTLTESFSVDMLSVQEQSIKASCNNLIEYLSIAINHEKKESTQLIQLNQAAHKKLLDNLLKNSGKIEAIWSNNLEGTFIYSNPPAGIPNGKIRPWFIESLKGNTYISEIYISAISKNPCVTISLPLTDESKKIVGVVGADLHLSFDSLIS